MIGPRNTVIRILKGEDVPMDEYLTDTSEFVDSRFWDVMPWYERPPELWAHLLHDAVGEEYV